MKTSQIVFVIVACFAFVVFTQESSRGVPRGLVDQCCDDMAERIKARLPTLRDQLESTDDLNSGKALVAFNNAVLDESAEAFDPIMNALEQSVKLDDNGVRQWSRKQFLDILTELSE